MLRLVRIFPPPAAALCISIASGIILLHAGIVAMLLWMAACIAATFIAVRRFAPFAPDPTTFFICAIAAIAGAGRYAITRSHWRAAYAACTHHHGPVVVRITDIAAGKGTYPHVITARITEHAENPTLARGWNMIIYAMQPPTCCVSDICRISMLRASPIDEASEYGLYLAKEGCVAVTFTQQCRTHRLARPRLSLRRACWQIRTRVIENLKTKMSLPVHTLATALVVGNGSLDRATLREMRSSFNQWGIVHQLARSGLHIVILLGLWQRSVAIFVHRVSLQHLILFLLMIAYAALSLITISFTRAVASYVIATIALLGARQQDALHNVALVACVIVLIQPLNLFALDFQLSFILTAALGWHSRIARAERRHH